MAKNKVLHGIIKRHPDGFGFFIPDDTEHPDVYIPRHCMHSVMTNDRVSVQAYPERGGDRYSGEIVEILERGLRRVVGRYYAINEYFGLIRDEGKGWGDDLRIPTEFAKDAKDKDLVAADILTYPGDKGGFKGKIVEVIGDSLDPMNDIKRVIMTQNIPQEFSKSCLEEAKQFQDNPQEKDFAGRVDLRGLDLITIDGSTAKDFDDAVYCEMNESGFKLFVAIADVSHYVKLNSAIDKDAYERGTSVYFPNFVVPMLPEVLSNGLCSLNPHVPRLCLVAEMQFDFTGEMMSSKFYEAVMESKARVTYGEAQEIIDGQSIEKLEHVKDGILRLRDLAKILMAKRFREGSMDLEIPETELVIDGSGVPVDIIKSERLFAHRLIEEMMLAANVAVAKFFSEKEIPAIYRIHEPPNDQALRMLERYIANFGGKSKLDGGVLQKRISRALEEFAGKPQAQILHILTLRTMSQAKYHPNNVGHFGLGFEHYTHFTSPIRRYPDLIVHRLVKYLAGVKGFQLMAEEDLATAGTVLSACEQRAAKSERQIHSIKKARYMEKHVGDEFDGIISSVTKFGVFVLLREVDVDGLIRLDALSKEKLEFDEENLSLYGKRSGVRFTIGDPMRIRVDGADHETGQINFAPADFTIEREERPSRDNRERSPYGGRERDRDRDRFKGASSKHKPAGKKGKLEQDEDFDESHEPSVYEVKANNFLQKLQKKEGPAHFRQRSPLSMPKKETPGSHSRPQRSTPSESREHREPRESREPREPRGFGDANIRDEKPAKDQGPNLEVLKMILGPDEFAKVVEKLNEKPAMSKKLQHALNSRNQYVNEEIVDHPISKKTKRQDRNEQRKQEHEARGKKPAHKKDQGSKNKKNSNNSKSKKGRRK